MKINDNLGSFVLKWSGYDGARFVLNFPFTLTDMTHFSIPILKINDSDKRK